MNALLSKISKKQIGLLALLVFIALTRLPFLINNTFAFGFDHGKDSLAIMHMVLTYSPKLIGPWTSIPGLFFGPGWYYLLAPFYFLGGFHPVSPVVAMVLLLMFQAWLAYRYLGWQEAVIIASAPTWMTISTSAWNPFPMTLLTLGIVIILSKLKTQMNTKQAFGLGFLSGMGFHFSAAFAVFYPIIIPILLIRRRVKTSFKNILAMIASFSIPFIPQLVFELRNGFVQTKGVMEFLSAGGEQAKSAENFAMVIKSVAGELRLAVTPELRGLPDPLSNTLLIISVVILLYGTFMILKNKRNDLGKRDFLEAIIWIGIPVIGLSVLHYNIWYVLALAPVVARLAGNILRSLPKSLMYVYMVLIFLTPISMVIYFYQQNKPELESSRAMLPIKLEVLDYIRDQAGDNTFSSYHYVPDIYDFSYQYLYFWQAYQGQSLPSEFAYRSDAPAYIVEKPELLARFNHQSTRPELIFYVVEKPHNQDYLDQWWDDQQYGEIISERPISSELTVYTATPLNKD